MSNGKTRLETLPQKNIATKLLDTKIRGKN
uniref:Uncharacterized protein n=1 Tax=Rhizophora mucronata TaxID=61149 RepID=A0A2P2PG06_RHIMU